MSKPTWNVCYSDSNTDTIKIFNIFEHKHFMQGCDKAFIKAKRSDREVFAEEVKIELRYWFWSKCEWELIIHGLFSTYNQKVDVFGQVMINWDRFIDYLWEWFKANKCSPGKNIDVDYDYVEEATEM